MKKLLLFCFVLLSISTFGQLTATTATSNILCNGDNSGSVTINASGGNGAYQYSINSAPFQVSNTFNNLSAGTYTYAVSDGNGLIFNSNFIITQPAPLVCNPILNGNILTIFVNGGSAPYVFSIDNGLTFVPINTFQLEPGVYNLIVRDANNCICFRQVFIPIPVQANYDNLTIYPSNIASSTSSTSVLANDYLNVNVVNNNVTLTAISVPSGFILNANGTISALAGTAAGTYTIQYKICENANLNNCATATATVTIPNNGILLKAFIDANGNSVQDNGEIAFTQGQFGYQLNGGTVNNIISSNGEFLINESNVANSYNLSFVINPGVTAQYSLATALYPNVNATGIGVTVYNFPITQLPFNDLAINIFQNGVPPRPGFNYVNKIQYKNQGNLAITAGTLTFVNNNVVTITNVSQLGTIINASGFTYNFTNLLPGESRFIDVTMQVPNIPTVALGQVLTNFVSTTIPAGDINIANNNYNLSQIIVGSYDPNDKVEAHGGKILYSSFTANDYLNYTIQFENTGTFYAENVRVNDVLDAKLDENSIRMVNATHPYILNRVGNNLNWNFNGIDLLPNGKGAITFQIKPKVGYALGDIIPNTASIFFDFNPAIVTNTFNTKFVSALGVSEFNNSNFKAFPNPTSNSVTVSLENQLEIDTIDLYDVLGKIIVSKKINALTSEIDLSSISKGIYFLKVKTDSQEKMIKVIKN